MMDGWDLKNFDRQSSMFGGTVADNKINGTDTFRMCSRLAMAGFHVLNVNLRWHSSTTIRARQPC